MVSRANERLLARIQFVRDKIYSVMLQLEDLRLQSEDVPMEEVKAVREGIGDLKRMSDTCGREEALSNEVKERVDLELLIADRIIQYRLGRLLAHLIGRLARKAPSSMSDLRCPCWSGRSFGKCCGAGAAPAGEGSVD